MKRLPSILVFSALVLLCSCGAQGPKNLTGGSGPLSGLPVGPSSPSPKSISGNWQFSLTPSVQTEPPAKLAGSIAQSGNSLVGALHVDGLSCFNQGTAFSLSGQ